MTTEGLYEADGGARRIPIKLVQTALGGASAGAVPASPAIAEGLPALVGDRDRVL